MSIKNTTTHGCLIVVIICLVIYGFVRLGMLEQKATENMISTINDDFQTPRAYFHPFTTEYERYSATWLPPWDPREQRDQEKMISSILSA